MTNLMKTLIASAAVTVIGTASFANAAFEEFNLNAAILNPTTDMNDDGDVTTDEIISMNEEVFDLDGDGVINAQERGAAEVLIENELG